MPYTDGRMSTFTYKKTESYNNLTESEIEKLKQSRARYLFVEVNNGNPRQVKCFDCVLEKEVWGMYKVFSLRSKETIFVPNC